jgi:putative SOS response-associated peptidase YedK
MCGRYRLSRRKQLVEEYFDTADWQDDWSPRCNVAPTQPVPVIRQNPKEPIRELSLMKWGLIPSWLDAGMQNVAAASELLMPYDARLMRCYPVSTRINHVVNDDEECSAPVEIIQIQNHLFG